MKHIAIFLIYAGVVVIAFAFIARRWERPDRIDDIMHGSQE